MKRSKFLSPDERSALESWLRSRLDSDLRNAALFLTLLNTGARPTEVLDLSWQDLDFESGEVYLATLKGGRPRVAVLPHYLMTAFERLAKVSPAKPFDLSYRRLAELWCEYRPRPDKTLRCLRHSMAIHALKASGGNVHFVQQVLGHRNIKNTMVYLDYQHSTDEYRRIFKIR